MSEPLTIALVILLDLLAGAVASTSAVVAARRWGLGWLLGTVCGLVVEFIRILLAIATVSPLGGRHGDALGWWVNLRFFNIPILVGLGFTAGSATARIAPGKVRNLTPAGRVPGGLVCPDCGLISPETADRCDCGFRFSKLRAP